MTQLLNITSRNISSEISSYRKFTLDLIPIGYLWFHSIFLNLTITVAILAKCEKTYLNMIYLSITLSDLLTGLICVTFEIFYKRFDAPLFNHAICLINRYFEYSSVCIALFSLLLLTIHRYFRLVRPTEEKESMTRSRYICIGVIWLGNILLWVFLYLILNDFVLDASVCDIQLDFFVVLFLNFILQICPICLLVVFNLLLLKHIIANIRHYKNVKFKYLINLKSSRYPKKLIKDIKATKYILVLTVNILCCWSLWIIDWPIHAYNDWSQDTFYQVSYWLNYVSSATNPIVLLFFSKPIRDNVKTIFCYSQDPPILFD